MATYSYTEPVKSMNKECTKKTKKRGTFSLWMILAVVTSRSLFGPHPMPSAERKRLAVMQRTIRSPGSRKQNRCVWMSPAEVVRWRSSWPPLASDDCWPAIAVPGCSLQDRPCEFLERFGSHVGREIFVP